MSKVTPTQARYLSFIHAYTEAFGIPPSFQEIADALGVRTPTVNGMLKTLDKKKLIEREPGVARSIEVLLDPKNIPPWCKPMSCNFEFWAPADVSQEWIDERFRETVEVRKAQRKQTKMRRAIENGELSSTVYQFKIVLSHTEPPIWRRFEALDVSLEDLHEIIQTVMGWTNSHLHEFQLDEQRFTHPLFLRDDFDDFGAKDYTGITIGHLIDEFGPSFELRYLYDFGDGWEHLVTLEKLVEYDKGKCYPRCVAGKLACPPEDVGGVWGYYDFLAAIKDPKHEMHEHYLEWCFPFEPEEFDTKKASARMQFGIPILFG